MISHLIAGFCFFMEHAHNWKDLTGLRFDRLIVISEAKKIAPKKTRWNCLCDCGNYKEVDARHLISCKIRSCGCFRSENSSKANLTHGFTTNYNQPPEYRAWRAMKTRCYSKNNKDYKNWGGRGIKVCDRWLNSFEFFLEDMGERPTKSHSLDRYPNINGDYEPSNCRWATTKQQSRGTRKNKWYEYNGVKMILADWAAYFNVNSSTLHEHLSKKPFDEVYLFYQRKKLLW